MTRRLALTLAAAFTFSGAAAAMAIEEAPYAVVERAGAFEVRDYAPHILAETVVDGDFEDAGSQAFRRLFRYISGANQTRAEVAMTAPVAQQPAPQKIAMTAPVSQQRVADRWAVSFMMPAAYTLETIPQPVDPEVTIRLVPARRVAAVRYSGLWTTQAYERHRTELESWVRERQLTVAGDAVWARYNAPFTPWFLRRNEILIPIHRGAP